MTERYDAIVVGAGIGGATCAALLARRGLRTLLLDKNGIPGGKAMTTGSEGYRYEFWPIVGGPSLGSQFARVLEELDMVDRVELLAPKENARLLYRGAGPEIASHLGSAQPGDGGPLGLVELLGLAEEDFAEVGRLFNDILQMGPAELEALDELPFGDFVSRYRVPQSVRSYLGMWSNIVFVVPLDLLSTSEAIRTFQDFAKGGAGRYHAGGYGRVAEVCCEAVERWGGRVLLKTRVDRIEVEDGAVVGVAAQNARFGAPIVVSNAGIQPTVLRLVGEQHFDRGYVARIRSLVPSWAIMGIRYFLDRPFFEQGMYLAWSDENVLDSERFARMKTGWLPEEVLVFNVVPAFYDPHLAPDGKQCALVGTLCSPDPDLAYAEALWERLDRTVKRLWPGIEACIASEVRYGTLQVSRLTRDAVIPGQGGECIGLAQIVGQCGRQKPSVHAPLRGLYFVGCDAGGYGCGTHQAADSGVNVAALVCREHRIRQAAF